MPRKQSCIKLAIFLCLFMVLCPFTCIGGEPDYKCYYDSNKMYSDISSHYQNFLKGENKTLYIDWEWFENRCWREAKTEKLSPNLKTILETIILDSRLSDEINAKTTVAYIYYAGKDAFIDFAVQHLKSFNGRLKKSLLFSVATKFNRFEEFNSFCSKNSLKITVGALFLYAYDLENNLKALAYLFDHQELFQEKIDTTQYDLAKFTSVSEFILSVLGRHLEIAFPHAYLNKMVSTDLRLLRNSIHATYGYNFQSNDLQNYFYGKYPHVNDFCRAELCGYGTRGRGHFSETLLTGIDKINIDAILAIEQAKK